MSRTRLIGWLLRVGVGAGPALHATALAEGAALSAGGAALELISFVLAEG